jgi:hypothetical protein
LGPAPALLGDEVKNVADAMPEPESVQVVDMLVGP